MFYKRVDPTSSFAPFAYLLKEWIYSPDNTFEVDFNMYSSLVDAVLSINKFLYCDLEAILDPNELAFGKCGPTVAVPNNAIG